MKQNRILLAALVIILVIAMVGCQEPAPAEFTVTFDANGGSAVAAQTVTEGEKATEPTAPTKEGYEFLGWYVGDTKYDFDTAVTANVTLKAKWEEKTTPDPDPDPNPNPDPDPEPEPTPTTYTVTFHTDGGSAVAAQTVAEGAKATKPADPTKTDFYFIGWYVGDTEYNFDAVVTESITVTAKWGTPLAYEALLGTWYGDVEGMGYYLMFYPDGTASAAISMDMMGAVYHEEIMMSRIELVKDSVLMTITEDGVDDTQAFRYLADGTLTDGEVVLSKVDLNDVLVGDWAGSEDYEGMQIPYTISVEDGTITATLDMFGSVTPLTVKSVGDLLVLDYMGLEIKLVYNGAALAGKGVMGGALALEPYVASTETMTLDLVAGKWVGSEEFYGYVFNYEFVINADGTGSASYYSVVEGTRYDTPMTIQSYAIVNNQLVITYSVEGMEYDPMVFSYVDGALVGAGPMETPLTLTRDTSAPTPGDGITLEDLAGAWVGTEVTEYGNYLYNITLNTDGTGTGTYVDEAGEYPSDMAITATAIDGNTVTVTFTSYGMEYSIVFTYENATLSSTQGAMWGTLTLTRGGSTDPNPNPDATVTLEDLAGTWTGTEATSFGDYLYEVTLNADGTGEGTYQDADGAYSAMYLENIVVTVEGNTVTFAYVSYNADYTIVFTYENGTLSSTQGAMWGTLTLTKN